MKKILFVVSIFLLASNGVMAQKSTSSANEIVKTACADAKATNKNVLIIFHASWCKWCHKMENAINDSICKPLFDANYIVKYIAVEEAKEKIKLETPGGNALKTKYLGKGKGLPFWIILDGDGNLLADCLIREEGKTLKDNGQNMGCPASDEEVAMFVSILKSSSNLQASDLEIIAKRFKENAK